MNVCYIAQEKVFYYVEHKNEAWSLDQPGRERTQYCLIAAEWIWKQVESKQEEKKSFMAEIYELSPPTVLL